jgi:O-antigen/teichoic acid export membrane protein
MYKNATLLLTASVARYAGQLGIFILIARRLGPTDAGAFALALAVTAPIFILAGLGMRTVYLTLHNEIAFTHYERLRAATVAVAILFSVGVSFFFPMHVAIIVAVVACAKALDSFSDLYGAALQKASRIRMTVLTSVVVAILQVGALAIALGFHTSLAVALTASTLTYMMVVVLLLRPITFRALSADKPECATEPEDSPEVTSNRTPGPRPWAEIARVGFATGVSLGLITVVSTLPQYFLGWTWGAADVGKYATLMYLVVAMEMALNALAQSWIPVGRSLEGDGVLSSRRILAVALRWTLITVPLAFVGIAIATVAFPLVLGPAYTLNAAEILPLAVAMILTPTVFASATSLAIQNRYHWALIGSTLTVLLGIAIGWALIRPFGIPGALWTYAACLALRSAASLAFTKHEPSTPHSTTAEMKVL